MTEFLWPFQKLSVYDRKNDEKKQVWGIYCFDFVLQGMVLLQNS